MKKYTLILLVFISLSAKSQVVNRFRDSTWFAKSVRFDSAIYLIKGASNGKVLTSDAYGRATWQSASGGVSQSALDDSINSVRSIRKVDTLYKNLDSIIYKINGIRYSIKDSVNDLSSYALQSSLNDSTSALRLIRKVDSSYIFKNASNDSICQIAIINGVSYRSCAKDSTGVGADSQSLHLAFSDSIQLSITRGNSIKFAYAIDSVSFITDSLIVFKGGVRKSYVKNTVSFAKNTAKDSIILTFNGVRYAVKDSVGSGTAYTFSTGLTNTAGTVTANLSTGIAGGQSVIGGTASGNNLTLSSTSHATKGKILFGNSTYNELTNMLGIGTTSPTQTIEVTRNTSGADYPSILIKNTNTSGDSHSAIDLQVNNGAVWSQLLAAGTNYVFGAPGMGFRVITNHPFFIQTNNVTRLTVAAGGNVGIGTLTPVASAKLELSSTTQGFLPPRMTATQASAIVSPAKSLIVYVTDTNGTFTSAGIWIYTTSWKLILAE